MRVGDHHSYQVLLHQLKQLRRKLGRKPNLNGVRIHDRAIDSALLYQLSYHKAIWVLWDTSDVDLYPTRDERMNDKMYKIKPIGGFHSLVNLLRNTNRTDN